MSTVISSGQKVTVTSGHVLNGAIVKGGTLVISAGGKTSGTQIQAGLEYVSNGGKSIAATVSNGGKEIVGAGGLASATTVRNGGILVDGASGNVVGAKILNGGTIDLAGGSFSGTIASGGFEEVTAAGNHNIYTGLAVKNGVTLTVSGGGKTSGTVISSGGLEIVGRSGTETAATVMNGGEILLNGGTATFNAQSGSTIALAANSVLKNQTIGAGATLIVSSGATASSTTLLKGATETVQYGGKIAGTTTMSSGSTLALTPDTATVSLAVSGFAAGDTIDLTDFAAGVITEQYTPSGGGTPQGVLTISGLARTASIHLFGQYTAAGFYVSQEGTSVEITYHAPAAVSPELAAGGHYLTKG